MILKPSSFLGRRFRPMVTRSSERLLASSIAYFATFERLPANIRNGVREPVSVLRRLIEAIRFALSVGMREAVFNCCACACDTSSSLMSPAL